ncbi:MAG: nuclease-related domain-containing protein [Solirubrobacteraceae bacterium]
MASNGSSARAGAYAFGRYSRALRDWRSRIRLILAAFLGPFIAVGLAGLFIEGHVAAWIAGMVFGIGAGVLIALRESPPAYIENWKLGAEGERKTEKALASLERPRWLVLHDVECPRGNYDHIVVGAAGVFLLETKNLQGTVHISDGEPRLRRRSDPEADKACSWIRSAALGGAAELKKEIERRTGRRLWVQAVVVLWSGFEEGVHEDEKCVFLHGSRLREWLGSRRDVLDSATTAELCAAVEAIANETGSEQA